MLHHQKHNVFISIHHQLTRKKLHQHYQKKKKTQPLRAAQCQLGSPAGVNGAHGRWRKMGVVLNGDSLLHMVLADVLVHLVHRQWLPVLRNTTMFWWADNYISCVWMIDPARAAFLVFCRLFSCFKLLLTWFISRCQQIAVFLGNLSQFHMDKGFQFWNIPGLHCPSGPPKKSTVRCIAMLDWMMLNRFSAVR